MAIGISTLQAIYQTYYPDNMLPYLLPENLPLLNMIQLRGRTDTATGDKIDMPWLFGAPGGVSQDFAAASAMAGESPQAVRPEVRLSQIYKRLEILDKDNLQSNGEAAYQNLMETSMAMARMKVLNEIDLLLHANGSGNRNQVASGVTSDTVQLVGPSVETSYEIGDQVVITSTDPATGAAPTVVSGPHRIVAVDGSAQSITLDSVVTVTTSNFIALRGNTAGFSSALLNPNLIGLGAYNNITAPSAGDSFLGVNRSVYANRLSGYRLQGQTFSIQAAVKRLASDMSRGSTPGGFTGLLMHPDDLDALSTSMASVQRADVSATVGAFSFDSVPVRTVLGTVTGLSDPHIEKGFARIVKPQVLELHYINGLPHLATLSGGVDQEFGANFDGRAVRMRGYMQLRCTDPRGLGIVRLPST